MRESGDVCRRKEGARQPRRSHGSIALRPWKGNQVAVPRVAPDARGSAGKRLHSTPEKFAVKIEADGDDVAALCCAEKVARAANFEVAHGDFESASRARSIV